MPRILFGLADEPVSSQRSARPVFCKSRRSCSVVDQLAQNQKRRLHSLCERSHVQLVGKHQDKPGSKKNATEEMYTSAYSRCEFVSFAWKMRLNSLFQCMNDENLKQLEFIISAHLEGEVNQSEELDLTEEGEDEVDLLEEELDEYDMVHNSINGEAVLYEYRLEHEQAGAFVDISIITILQ